MKVVRKHAQFTPTSEYNVLVKRLYPDPGVETPFGSAHVVVDAGSLSKPHLHHEHETFIILSGAGTFVQGAVHSDVAAGDVIYIEPFTEHYIEAPASTPLEFMSIWWEGASARAVANPTHHVIFTPPPTPNGDLHLGHIAGPYICADIIRRYLKQQGKQVSLIVGTDKNQSYVDLKARQTGVSPQSIYNGYNQSIMQTFDNAGMGYDAVHDCDSDYHLTFVHQFIQRLLDQQILRIDTHSAVHCEQCQVEVFDAFAKGCCATCGASSNGCVCEDCGSPNNSYNLLEVRCTLCGGQPLPRSIKKAALDLARCADEFATAGFEITAPARLEDYVREQCKKHPDDYIVTFNSAWGVPARHPELAGQTYLAWLEMAGGYIAALYKSVFHEETADVALAIERLNTADVEIIHLMGFDNSFFYAYLYPRLFAALGLRGLRITFVVNEFLLLEQSKFSTSRNHAIWANDVFSSPEDADWYRFYLTLQRPEGHRENYQHSEFVRFREATQASVSAVFATHRSRLDRFFAGVVPEPGAWAGRHQKYSALLGRYRNQLTHALDVSNGYAVKQYGHTLKGLIDIVVRYQRLIESDFVASSDPDFQRTSLFLEAEALELLQGHLSCVMPHAFNPMTAA